MPRKLYTPPWHGQTKDWEAAVKRTGQPTCMHRVETAMYWLYWSAGSVSMAGLRLRM